MELLPGSHADVVKGKTWWTSVWPLFVVSVLMTLIAQAAGLSGVLGVGGLGAILLGTILSFSFAARPVYSIGQAFLRGIIIGGVFHLVIGVVFMWGPVAYKLQHAGYSKHDASIIALKLTVMQIAVQLPVLALTWAIIIVRKARRLVAASQSKPITEAS